MGKTISNRLIMQFTAKVTEVENKEDHYDLEIKTYKGEIKGRFERSELRNLIEIIDNAITVGVS